MPKYDVVIIGSGLGGLLCANILSKEGMNVCVLEKQHQFGGNLQTFNRKGKIFDTGIHYVGGLGKGQNLHQYFKYFDIIDKLRLRKLDDEAFDKISYQDKIYNYAQGFDHYVETLTNDFPKEKHALLQYKKQIKEICNHFPLYNLRPNLGLDNEHIYFEQSVDNFIQSITDNKTLQNVLTGNNLLYAGVPDKTPVAIHALISNSLIEGAYRFEDGSQQITNALIETIKNNGGTLLNNSEVKEITVHNGKAESAVMANGEIVEANHFISAIHPSLTLQMTDSKLLRKSYRTRINEIEETISVFAVYIDFKPGNFEYLNYNFYHFNEDSVWNIANYNANKWPQKYLFLTPPSSKSKQYAETGSIMTYMKYEEVKKWENSSIGNRGNAYKDFKIQKAEKLINELNKQFPNLKNSIENYYTSTPLTLKEYTGTKEGSMYGILHDCNNALKTRISPKTKIPNLFLSGQNVNIHGVLGTTVASVLTCTEMLGMEYLLKKINYA